MFPTLSYQVQKLLGNNGGDTYLETNVEAAEGRFAASAVRDSKTGDTVIKLVNGEGGARALGLELKGYRGFFPTATKTVLFASDPDAVNTGRDEADGEILPVSETLGIGLSFELEVEPYSLTIIRVPAV